MHDILSGNPDTLGFQGCPRLCATESGRYAAGAMSAWSRFGILALLAFGGCTPTTDLGDYLPAGGASLPPWLGRTRGGAAVLSQDERIAVIVNRSAGVVSVFTVDPSSGLDSPTMLSGLQEVQTGVASEPWAAALAPDGNTAYVVLRREQRVARIANLRGAPTVDAHATVGSEPTAIAIAPSGRRLFVANWADGTISVIYIGDGEFYDAGTLDLNEALVTQNVLGSVSPRRALAHPRALAITDDGDDDDGDETLYATEFYSQALHQPDLATDAKAYDRARQGIVYVKRLGTEGTSVATLAPVTNTGFSDSAGDPTGCFPNQLYGAVATKDRLLVSGVCASPAGPLGPAMNADMTPSPANFKAVSHPAVFVVKGDAEVPEERVLLTELLDTVLYPSDGVPADSAVRRMPLIPNDLAIAPHGAGSDIRACLPAFGADALFCLERRPDGWTIGKPGARYADLGGARPIGRLPIGAAVSRNGAFALVANDNTQNVSVVDLATYGVAQTTPATTQDASPEARRIRESEANKGRAFFATGLGVWSYAGQAWASCEACHPDGLSDGVTWFFSRGPRRTISTAATFTGDEQRILLWTGNVDEIHDVEGIVRSVHGGVGAVLRQYPTEGVLSSDLRLYYDGSPPPGMAVRTGTLLTNLNGSLAGLVNDPSTPVKEWNAVESYVRSVRTPRPPTGLDADLVARGRATFQAAGCAGCHGGPSWTLSRRFYAPGAANNGALPYDKTTVTPETLTGFLGTLRTRSYEVPLPLRTLNPPGASGSALLRRFVPPPPEVQSPVDYAYDAKTALEDQINCVLRDVGTFPRGAGDVQGITLPASTPVREVRADMTTVAQGATGFNVPSLLGLSVGAPYFHAGNARTLEEAFHQTFDAHLLALQPDLPLAARTTVIQALVQFLLSIGDETASEWPMPGTTEHDLCPRTLSRTRR